MDCNYIKNNLFAIAEKRLNEADLVRVTEHVSRCSSCAGTLESFSLFVDAIDREKQTQFNPFLATRILSKMEAHGDTREKESFSLPKVLKPVLAISLIILAVLTGFIAGRQGNYVKQSRPYESELNLMKADLFISELNDEDKTLKFYK